MSILIQKNETITVPVYVWTNEAGKIMASNDKSDIPENAESLETVNFIFKKPNYGEHLTIMKKAKLGPDGFKEYQDLQDAAFDMLLKDWDLKDNDGKAIPCTRGNVRNLPTVVAQSAFLGISEYLV